MQSSVNPLLVVLHMNLQILHDYLRILASAKDAMSNRSNCLAEFQQAEKICIGKKDRKEKMAGTPKAAAADSEYEEVGFQYNANQSINQNQKQKQT